MKRILINGNNAKTGGGKTILQGVINAASSMSEFDFVVIIPAVTGISKLKSKNIQYISLANYYQYSFLSPFVYSVIIPRIIRNMQIDFLVNLGDLLINTEVNQSYIFDWPYAVYEEKSVWGRLSIANAFIKNIKLALIKSSIKKAKYVFAQTTVVKKRLEQRYQLQNVNLLPVPVDNMSISINYERELPEGIKFLYLSYYYPHKNFEILLEVAQLIKRSDYNYKILLTIEPEQHSGARLFIETIIALKLDSVLVNLGGVQSAQRYNLIKKCDALLMPTLLETYGIPYIEAMLCQIPIFTSDLDFSHSVCNEAAFYFDPKDSASIFNCMSENISNSNKISDKLVAGKKNIDHLPNWDTYLKLSLGLKV